MSKVDELRTAVLEGMSKKAAQIAQDALDEGATPQQLVDVMADAMNEVGDLFSKMEIYVPEMLISAKAMNKAMEVISPLMKGDDAASKGACIIGTVKGDLHDIGKNLVATMIGAAGFDMIDLGVDVPIDTFKEKIENTPNLKIVALSALLTSTMPSMAETIEALKPLREKYGFKILIGGAPITQAFCDEHGADGYSIDAGAAAVKAKELVG